MDEFQARAGDEVAIGSHRLRGARRTGTILEVMGAPGHEYYRVRWDDGRETVFHPGSDAVVVPRSPRPRRETKPVAIEARPQAKRRPRPKPQPPGLKAAAGDRLVIHGHRLGERDRDAEILEVLGEGGGPPFRVRWSETGREGLLFPGPDALIDHIAHRRSRARKAGGG